MNNTLLHEDKINQAIDAFADDNTELYEQILEEVISTLRQDLIQFQQGDEQDMQVKKKLLASWAFCLNLLDEHDQAMLKYEEALRADPTDDDLVFQMVEILLHQLQKPEQAKTLLEERLLKSQPDNEDFKEAYALAKVAIPPEEMQEIVLDPERKNSDPK